ncbi:TadE/TadG family type IV pilus assembly protein [Aliivibrio fischeri]|uniref:TadE-like protein n=1 Tax=Aliivibrio fischeri (strain ATCC 700601 / ES114) TaxID=312309 RepID=Q5E0Z9_ALIF1|nr:TadE family protein [Aliivibrio fischeri]AAW87297.1 TadE-like protein [Aliivibrio fischeri ES114]KLU78059.1 pilus assembly protein TadE [Aliivibrio fischeri]MCE7535848.1 pilus assembly protein [Aliivibrio fischeri]MCE7555490.1 pilus assembly protein [Aliivibrio fischeri]MCE7558510.1 pilus assembly protein [Aliivibrio fischeri]
MKIKKNRGVASIEFAMGFMVFWLICMAWVEMSYMSYVSAISDLIISESARESKTKNSDYLQAFTDAVNDNQSIWGNVVDPSKFTMSIQYLKSVNELGSLVEPCTVPDSESTAECGSSDNSSIAVYRIDYRFSPIFTYFMGFEGIFSREDIVIQEYERDAFKV